MGVGFKKLTCLFRCNFLLIRDIPRGILQGVIFLNEVCISIWMDKDEKDYEEHGKNKC